MARPHGPWPLLVLVLTLLSAGPAAATQGVRGRSTELASLAGTQPTALPLTVELNVTPTQHDLYAMVYDFCNVTGGTPPYTTVTLSTGDPSGAPYVEHNLSAPASVTGGEGYIQPGVYVVVCTATDSASATASASVVVHIIPLPTVTVAASPSSLVAGSPVTFTATPHNGTAPYTYLWMGLPPGCPYRNASQVRCTPTGAGTWTVTVTLVDAQGASIANAATVTVTPLVLGLPQTEAALVLGALAVGAAAGLAAFLFTRRRKAGPPPAATSEPGPEEASTTQTEKGVVPLVPAEPGPARRGLRAPVTRKAIEIAVFLALGAVFYLVVAWYFSFLTGSGPYGLFGLVVLLGILVTVTAIRALGFVLPLAGFVGGTALYYALAQPFSACTNSPAVAQGLGVPTCGAFALTALGAAAVVGVVGAGAAVFLLRVSRFPRSVRPLVALGTVAVAMLVALGAFAVTTPPAGPYPSNLGPQVLPFPLPAGSTFLLPFETYDAAANFTFGNPRPQALVPVAADGSAPAVLVGAWNATATICFQVQAFGYGGAEAGDRGLYIACGASGSFRVPLTPAVWQVQFSLPNLTGYGVEVTITQTIQVVY